MSKNLLQPPSGESALFKPPEPMNIKELAPWVRDFLEEQALSPVTNTAKQAGILLAGVESSHAEYPDLDRDLLLHHLANVELFNMLASTLFENREHTLPITAQNYQSTHELLDHEYMHWLDGANYNEPRNQIKIPLTNLNKLGFIVRTYYDLDVPIRNKMFEGKPWHAAAYALTSFGPLLGRFTETNGKYTRTKNPGSYYIQYGTIYSENTPFGIADTYDADTLAWLIRQSAGCFESYFRDIPLLIHEILATQPRRGEKIRRT